MSTLAIYPGSFDPVTLGHVDIVERSLGLFDEVIVLIAESSQKKGLFSISEKKEHLQDVFKHEKRVIIDVWPGLLMEYAGKKKANAIVRGLRAVSDFEYEFQMAAMNKRLRPSIDTIFMMTSEKYYFVSSHLVREIASLGGALTDIVPPVIEKRLKEKFKK
ncbi:MAG: pantetheine-phosphate adenylyltransferase [Deltaproteobacteria bacterium GWA2_38_16]|nr:MAG: pantetheine-phosphate adenylyltransferase [Deltaproteobacteria bacterium GWA2_38_16]OGQ02029.1 MAG: pantetheine-phosphate adenylyltransferase [Deltaproteobacteria bacterium RIFCSPHIGHO2_02_FULL_38_15]OGQ30895.1 MAG: pantetheine-phosphate adenylyltransferase [Deltaproteobacteria bacterium RIFCSPLOWO2_01_FULL_38_9]OGQ61079.1 MAG: pantetheine-phosphate adenylyltransferase [Deltaproteobacteria bacterium RIFCSPLOWO2_12_FULL_38_8]HBQ21563.1 pantetheine-phosphate adenylyltransferase [Deltaprot